MPVSEQYKDPLTDEPLVDPVLLESQITFLRQKASSNSLPVTVKLNEDLSNLFECIEEYNAHNDSGVLRLYSRSSAEKWIASHNKKPAKSDPCGLKLQNYELYPCDKFWQKIDPIYNALTIIADSNTSTTDAISIFKNAVGGLSKKEIIEHFSKSSKFFNKAFVMMDNDWLDYLVTEIGLTEVRMEPSGRNVLHWAIETKNIHLIEYLADKTTPSPKQSKRVHNKIVVLSDTQDLPTEIKKFPRDTIYLISASNAKTKIVWVEYHIRHERFIPAGILAKLQLPTSCDTENSQNVINLDSNKDMLDCFVAIRNSALLVSIPDHSDMTPCAYAIKLMDTQIFNILLNAQPKNIMADDFHIAVQNNNLEIFKILLNQPFHALNNNFIDLAKIREIQKKRENKSNGFSIPNFDEDLFIELYNLGLKHNSRGILTEMAERFPTWANNITTPAPERVSVFLYLWNIVTHNTKTTPVVTENERPLTRPVRVSSM